MLLMPTKQKLEHLNAELNNNKSRTSELKEQIKALKRQPDAHTYWMDSARPST